MLPPDPLLFRRAIAPCCTAALLALTALPALAVVPVQLQRPDIRLFGYQLGDVIVEPIDLVLAPGYSLDPSSLPRAGKRAGWWTLRNVRSQSAPDAQGGTRLHLDIEVQLVNAPKVPQIINVPPIALRFKGGPTPYTEIVPSLTVDVVPLGTGQVRSDLPDMRGLRPAPLVDDSAARERLHLVGMAGAGLAAWLLLALAVQLLRPRRLRPFAHAARELRRLLKAMDQPDGARTAMQRMHRAFDEAAGQRLFAEAVSDWCHRLGADAALHAQTVQFFARSRTLFFEPEQNGVPAGLRDELRSLARAWQQFERRHP